MVVLLVGFFIEGVSDVNVVINVGQRDRKIET